MVAFGFIGSYFLLARWDFMQRFHQPDTALAWIALCFSLALLTQYVTGLRGTSYIFADKERRGTMDKDYNKYTKSSAGGLYMKSLRVVHWLSLAFILVLFSMLVKSTFIDPQIETPTYQRVQELIQESNKDLIDRIDKLITTMEANNVSTE